MADIDPEAVHRFVRAAKATANPRLPADVPNDAPPEVVLTTLRLLADGGRVTNAAQLLFGQDPQRVLPMARVRVARFRTGDEIVDYPPAVGTVFDQISAAMRAVEEYNPTHLSLSEDLNSPAPAEEGGGMRREERRRYPPRAVLEAIVNAVVHRDYLAPGDVQIRVQDDRLVIWNPGGLPQCVTVADLLKRPHPSVPRNGLIANAAYVARLFEGWGTGTTRMAELCREAGLPDPIFGETAGGFTVTLISDPLSEDLLVALGLNERQRSVLPHARTAGGLTNADYRRLTAVSKPTATRDLDDLVERGILVRIGQTGCGTRYVLKGLETAQRAH